MTITAIKKVSQDCMHIATSCGTFVFRTIYLSHINPQSIDIDVTFNSEEEQNDIIDASFAFLAEQHAISYLSRSEQSRFMLETKLYKKDLSKLAITKALDYLQEKKYLDNKRFAESWIRNRTITKTEGPTRLSIELTKRGVEKSIIKDVLDEYFEDNDIHEVFTKAVQKLTRLGKSGEKLQQALLRQGFDWKLVRSLGK